MALDGGLGSIGSGPLSGAERDGRFRAYFDMQADGHRPDLRI